ncbi:MAG: peptidoglycan-binding domain-containing protein [Candidatus Microsaccharimonas sp.]
MKSFKFFIGIAMVLGLVLLPFNQVNAASGCVVYTYRQGNSGSCVKNIQTIITLNTRSGICGNVNTAVVIDGSFGPKTAAGVKAFQRENCLTADGIVGPNTWRALCTQAFYTRVASPSDNTRAWSAGLSSGCATLSGMSNYCYSNRWCMHV